MADKIGNNGSSSQDSLLTARSGGGGQSIVRNVPIRLERRGEADGAQKTSDDYGVSLKSVSASSNPHRSRSPPPPPPQRRHFNLNGPLLLSSLTAPTTSSTSSSGSDEERAALASGGSGQPSPNNVAVVQNGSATTGRSQAGTLPELSSSPSVRQLPTSFYDSPSSLLTAQPASASKISPNGTSTRWTESGSLNSSNNGSSSPSLVRRAAESIGAVISHERPRYATIMKKDASLVEQQRRSPMTVSSISNGGSTSNVSRPMNASAVTPSSFANETNSITTYDVPRSLRSGTNESLKGTAANRAQNHSSPADGGLGSSGQQRTTEEGRSGNEVDPVERLASYKPITPAATFGKKVGANPSGEPDAERLSISSMDSKSSDYQELLSGSSELRLSAAVAMDTLIKLLENLQAAVDKLCGYATRNWRRKEYLESHIVDIRASCRQTIAALKDFFDFSSGAFVNVNKIVVSNANAGQAATLPTATGANPVDGRLAKHLAHLVRPLGDSLRLLIKLQQTLDISGWMVPKLAREGAGNDSLDQFIAVAKQVPQDARQVASFIHGNIALIFPPSLLNSFNASATSSRILSVNGSGGSSSSLSPNTQQSTTPSSSQPPQQRTVRFAEDVHLSTGEIASINGGGSSTNGSSSDGKSNRTLTNGGPADSTDTSSSGGEESIDAAQNMRRSFFDDYDYVGEPGVENRPNGAVDSDTKVVANGKTDSILLPEDRQILQFYSPQVENHIACLSNAIDDFLLAVEQNESPKVFVGHSKFVILGAHKLVYIGDSIAQCIRKRELGEKVKQCADHLCEVLKYCVTATKQAALQYPSVPCVQAMVDSMVNVSHAAYELKLLIQEAANL